jgi:predicted Ser/Thr protein kinase
MGKNSIFQWIVDIAAGILELEQLGIYHSDLAFRNTIRVTENKSTVFKIIDYDKAFKVSKTKQRDRAFETTSDVFAFWLRFHFDRQLSRAPFEEIDLSS